MKNESSPTFCVLPWMHLATNPTGHVRLCCNSTPGKNLVIDDSGKAVRLSQVKSVNDYWNSAWLKNVRKQMLTGERPVMCERCFREEDSGVKSARQAWNEKFTEGAKEFIANTSEDGEAQMNIEYVDLRLGNLCNLKCVMCNPYSSNQWTKDWNELYPQDLRSEEELKRLTKVNWFEEDSVWQVLGEVLPSIREIYLTGGEPTLAKKQYQLLQTCIDTGYAKKITLKYNTNIVFMPQKLIEYWRHFKEVRLNISIDGYGSVNEVIRYPSNWSEIHDNLTLLDRLAGEANNIRLQVHTTVQVYNIFSLIELFEYLQEFKNIQSFPYLNILNHPKHLNIRVLPLAVKQELKAKYEEWISRNSERFSDPDIQGSFKKLSGMLAYMMKEDWSGLYGEFKNFNSRLEKLRNQQLSTQIPELAQLESLAVP